MPVAPVKYVPHIVKTIIIEVYSYRGKNICGLMGNPQMDNGFMFHNTAQMLFGIERIINANKFPQANMELRSFEQSSDSPKLYDGQIPEQETAHGDNPAIATFKLTVMFRQNASWQGSLAWLENESEVQYRSVLELIHLLDSALDGN